MALLSVAGALVGNAWWPNPLEGWAEPPVLNMALVGNPSSGKSPALDAVAELLRALQAAENEDWSDRHREHQRMVLAAKLARET